MLRLSRRRSPFPRLPVVRRATVALASGLALTIGGCKLDRLLSDPADPGSGENAIPPGSGAARLAFAVYPRNTVAGAPLTPAIEVRVLDTVGGLVPDFTGSVTLALDAPSAGATLSGGTVRDAVGGVATFPGLSIDQPGSGYRLAATAPGLSPDTSPAFDITTVGAPVLSLVSGDGQTDTVGATLAQPVVVRVADSAGAGLAGVTVKWTVTSGGGAVTPASTTDVDGYARATRTLGTTVGQHTATAALSGATGSPIPFTATATPGAAANLTFTVQPTNALAGGAIAPPVEVTARDGFGNTASEFAGLVTLTLGTNPSGGSLGGTTTRAAVAGIATFPGLSVDRAASGYRLTAAADGLSDAISVPFDISPTGGATTIQSVSGNGQTGVVGTALPQPYVVRVTDALGAPVAGIAVTWSVSGGGSMAPASTTTDQQGEARAVHTLGTTAGSQTAAATATGLTGSPVTFTSTAVPDAPARLVFTQQPGNTTAGAVISPVGVTAEDQFGNTATNFAGTVTMTIAPLTGTPGATLSGTRTRTLTAGVAVFDDLRIDLPGAGYRLRATAGTLTVDSAPFNVAVSPPAGMDRVSGDGQQAMAGSTLPAPYVVRVTDAQGNPVAGVSVGWLVTGGGGSVAPGGTTTDDLGEARATHTLGLSAGPQQAQAAVAGLAGSPVAFTSTATPGPLARLVFTQQPTNTPLLGTITPPVRVTVEDAFGNVLTGFTGTVSLSIAPGTGTPLATLSGTTARPVENGVAVFDDLRIDLAGLGYRLRAAIGNHTADSQPFNVLL